MESEAQFEIDNEFWTSVYAKADFGFMPSGGHVNCYRTGGLLDALLHQAQVYTPGEGQTFLDFGCGNGRMTPHVAPNVGRYIGIDVIPECVAFCAESFEMFDNCEWHILNARNARYAPQHTLDVAPFPVEDESVDSLVALSVFTHLATYDVAQFYAEEVHRVLKPGGRACVTFFQSPPNDLSDSADRTVYSQGEIRDLLTPFMLYHHTGGESTAYNDQYFAFLEKP